MESFREGFRFACLRGCTRCCAASGWVYLTEADLKRAAGWLGLSAREFEQRYVYRTRHLLRLRKPPHAQCPFLTGDGCAIHPVKPTQCRAFPFWPELISSRQAWRSLARRCPGVGQGERVPFAAVQRIADEMLSAYPSMYSHFGKVRRLPARRARSS